MADDQSPQIRKILRQTILDSSYDIIFNRLEFSRQIPPEFRENLNSLLDSLHFDLVKSTFHRLVAGNLEDIDLEKAALLLSYWNNPSVNLAGVRNKIDQYAAEVGSRFALLENPFSQVEHLSYFMFKKYNFRGNTDDYYHPDNSFLDRVLETHKGIPISLSLLIMLIGQRLSIPLEGVPMPAHFILKFISGGEEMFFDPYYRGQTYSRQECLAYLNNANVENPHEILDGCPHYQIVLRIMRNIRLVYSSYRDEEEKVSQVEQFISLIEQHYQ